MYCTRCGKQIDYDAPLCLECTAEMANKAREEKKYNESEMPRADYASEQTYENSAQQTYTAPQQTYAAPEQTYVAPNPDTRKEGLGKAICSLVFSFIIPTFGGMAIGFMISELVGAGVFFALATIAMGVVSIINGAMSIKTFKNVKNEGNPAPIPTLIIGIVGLAMSALSLLICFIYYIVAVSVLM